MEARNWIYVGRCIEAKGEEITEMVNAAHEITRTTFRKYVDRFARENLERQLNYDLHANQGLTMASDFHVAYYRSTYRGLPCVYFVWSAIEHIFQAEGY